MLLRVAASDGSHFDGQPDVLLLPDGDPSSHALEQETLLGHGVHVAVDLSSSHEWRSIRVTEWDDAVRPLMRMLIGEGAVRQVDLCIAELVASGQPSILVPGVEVDLSASGPWLRVAVVDALDRWLHAPLDQSLVDAERGIARTQASLLLPAGEIQRQIFAGGLVVARRATSGLTNYLSALIDVEDSPPKGIHDAIARLVNGYQALNDEIDGSDREVQRVVRRWAKLSARRHASMKASGTTAKPRQVPFGRPTMEIGPGHRSSSLIDPRQVRARVLGLSADPVSAEVSMLESRMSNRQAVLVKVAAYRRQAPQLGVHDRMLVRLVDRRSGSPHGEALLTLKANDPKMAHADSQRLFFEGTVPLRGSDVGDLRADVFDALSDVPPAASDTDETLQQVRRATMFLRGWRQIIAEARLPSLTGRAAVGLSGLVTMLTRHHPGADQNNALFKGGPTPADLNQLVALGDVELLRMLRSGEQTTGGAGSVLASSSGAGALLLAELAAVHAHGQP